MSGAWVQIVFIDENDNYAGLSLCDEQVLVVGHAKPGQVI